jgi:hypothetical protein
LATADDARSFIEQLHREASSVPIGHSPILPRRRIMQLSLDRPLEPIRNEANLQSNREDPDAYPTRILVNTSHASRHFPVSLIAIQVFSPTR